MLAGRWSSRVEYALLLIIRFVHNVYNDLFSIYLVSWLKKNAICLSLRNLAKTCAMYPHYYCLTDAKR